MYSVVTLVNDPCIYARYMRPSVSSDDVIAVEYPKSAAIGLNEGIAKARHDIVVLCHQDVIFPAGWEMLVLGQIQEIGDYEFGVIGTFGVDLEGRFAGHIRDPHNNPRLGRLPCRAMTLDEHCLIVRKSSGLLFDEALPGFHLYGADVCLQAAVAGLKNYVIDAHLVHLSGGKVDQAFKDSAERFVKKWKSKSPYTILTTTCGRFQL